MYIVTGGAGFIGSGFVWKLNSMGIEDVLIVDRLGHKEKWKNLVNLRFQDFEHKDCFLDRLEKGDYGRVEAIIHMGACSSTTESDADYLMYNNFSYSQRLARYCISSGSRFIYASSAATYGDGSRGFSDDPEIMPDLQPLNMYGYSKQLFDLWMHAQGWLDRAVGLKFFNVYGPNEYHKEDMQSVVRKAYFQVKQTGRVRLFKSYHPDYEHGEQKRDFIYLKDCLEAMSCLLEHQEVNGVFNLGSGRAESWNDLAGAVFKALGRETDIEYIDMPEEIRPRYQYFTRAQMHRLEATGCPVRFSSLEEGVHDYILNHLEHDDPYLSLRPFQRQ
ncbi:ADP-glyceromanno-heptose 6-epimerase [Desulfonatronospira sp. MSAO_Bac3]|uniref:ADP-glyceromanno-heptose 6-epimerase n=1 Tax=Desulfonatronospira sp. MSAO_Bac3 TaxID=2293857 RepID=UPI000FF6BD02|nr:ADP-glyceromanno-heptose 6-epimerase [Desulfonatronospira sp. MSAO_Bac3]RQD77791.1 MAG: ADP-glyceromanno-heptose 6-epimerase [Desulfonatronospira sp. MSAO_Bac3]